jgi:heptosyltransferase-2
MVTAARKVGPGKPYAALHVGAGNAIKRWMPDRFAWVARELTKRARVRVAVLSGPGEEARAGEPVLQALPRAARIDLRGSLPLPELAAVIRGADLFLGNDGGAAHVAAAVGTPSVIVFAGTSLSADWAPRGARVTVIEKWVPCKPCHSTTCPFNVECLRAATVDEVLAAALQSLPTRKTARSR